MSPSTPAAQTPRPSPYPAASLPVRGHVVRHAELLLAPAPDGVLYVLIPDEDGAVLARLDRTGAPAPGWPVTLPHATRCTFLEAGADGSIRAICDAEDIRQPDLCCNTVRAFAIDPEGRPLPGWPVEIDVTTAARVVGEDLVVLADLPVTDTVAIGQVTKKAHLSRIGADGAIVAGAEVPIVDRGGWETWAIGPDGVAYGTSTVDAEVQQRGEILAIDLDGSVDGWPVGLRSGDGSPPAIAADGRIVVLVGAVTGSPDTPSPLHVEAVNPRDLSRTAISNTLPIEVGYEVDCSDSPLYRPLLSRGGVTVVRDGMSFYALDASLRLLGGWPYDAPSYLQEQAYPGADGGDGIDCSSSAAPALGPDGTLFAPLSAESESTGGSLVAVAKSGNGVPGWPVTLRQAASGFWWVAVAPDGTVFAAAVEREKKGVSATILGIAPDSTVRWRTTVLEP